MSAAVGLAWGMLAWLLTGWDESDARRFLGALHAFVLGACDALDRTVRPIVGRLERVAEGECAPVGLGEVSEMIDVVRLGLMAGLSFDAALGLYCSHRSSALSARLAEARLMWQVGLATREEGLLHAARDLNARPLESFAMAVVQAVELGAPLATTLERQSKEARAAHRAEVERQIERAPVKMLIPTGTLILPALLLSIVGPLLAAGGMI